MDKGLKIIICLVLEIILLFVIDLICIFTINRPLFGIKEDNGDSVDIIYKGLIYDTVICYETLKPQIVLNGFSYSCSYNGGKYILIDNTKKKINFSCAEVLESFYEDDEYIYFWDCKKNNYMIVEYDNGYEETISDALMNKHIVIQDLDKFEIDYIKEER